MVEPTIRHDRLKRQVEITVPDDGGTPRDPACIRQGGRCIHIRTQREEGRNPLSHAISRVELVIRNHDAEPVDTTVAIDLSGGGPAPSSHPRWGAMEERDYVYVRPPDGHWQRVDGEIEDWTVTVRLGLQPGDTLLALSPGYSYGDYLRFVRSLPSTPLLHKVLLGRSDGGREHRALRISNPGAPAERKLRFMLSARAHAYESFGSFAMEGMIRYLLSNPPGANLKLFEFLVQPMLNVDGVALGYEYAQGFEHGPQRDLRACASGRLYFSCIDDWRPHVLVSLHNWITPRAWDVISYTDVDPSGRRTDRAQEIFRSFFPPQTEYGKGWLNDVDEPLSHNWARENEKASPNMENPEVHARITHGTEIWVPELPWFGRDDGDPAEIARDTGRRYLRALLQTLVRLHALPAAVLEPPQERHLLSAHQPLRVAPAGSDILQDRLPQGPIVLDRVVFPHGLAMPVGVCASYELAGRWETFSAVTGLVAGHSPGGEAELCVEGDGRSLWVSGPRHPGDRRQRTEIDVRGVRVLTLASRLLAGPANDLCSVWADANVRRRGNL